MWNQEEEQLETRNAKGNQKTCGTTVPDAANLGGSRKKCRKYRGVQTPKKEGIGTAQEAVSRCTREALVPIQSDAVYCEEDIPRPAQQKLRPRKASPHPRQTGNSASRSPVRRSTGLNTMSSGARALMGGALSSFGPCVARAPSRFAGLGMITNVNAQLGNTFEKLMDTVAFLVRSWGLEAWGERCSST
jgi:hypothetical protein